MPDEQVNQDGNGQVQPQSEQNAPQTEQPAPQQVAVNPLTPQEAIPVQQPAVQEQQPLEAQRVPPPVVQQAPAPVQTAPAPIQAPAPVAAPVVAAPVVAQPAAPAIPVAAAASAAGAGDYGYVDDEEMISSTNFKFGLNEKTFMTKCQYITNAGKDGAAGEALDIIFNINGTEKSYRKFPVTQAYKGNEKITDRNAPEFKEEMKNWNAVLSHVLHCFTTAETMKAALARGVGSFKEYCKIVESLLPKDYDKIELDIFLQWQYQVSGENDRTYLEIPKKMKSGKFLTRHVPASDEKGWMEVKKESPADNDNNGLIYVDTSGKQHPFSRNGWFVNSAYATQQRESTGSSVGGYQGGGTTQATAGTSTAASKPSGW